MNIGLRIVASLLLLLALTAPAAAQLDPRRPIRLIVGFGSGSVLEVGARAIAEPLQQHLGKPIVVENRPGGGGSIANEFVAGAAPDGHALVVDGLGSHAVLPAIRRRLSFDMERDFTAIARFGEFPLVLMVANNSPAQACRTSSHWRVRVPAS